MTIPATPRRSPVYVGNGTATDYAFTFKVTDPATLVVTVADENDLNSQVLVNGVDYTVTLNGDQNASPGGSISYAGLPVGHRLVITSDTDSSQPTAISNLGAFHANVLEGALDRIVILHQQQQEQLDRAVKVGITSEQDPSEFLQATLDIAANSATQAAASASAASGSATAASASASAASTSETNAAASAASALSSKNAAAASETAAATSASNAAGSEANALSYRNTASTHATNAGNSATAAAGSASTAATKAGEASTSASNAATSETNAANSASAASASATLAASYATTVGTQSFRNKIINGGFDIWQRATSQTSNAYGSDDRWTNGHDGSTKTHSRQAFAAGQTDVPGNPSYYSRTVVTSVAGAANYALKAQKIEGVRTFSGKNVTLSFHAKADAAKNIAIEFEQIFGTGGSPSSTVRGIGAQKVALTTAWQRFEVTIAIPSIAGKTLGSNGNDALRLNFWFDAGSSYNARTATLGQQSGTFDIANVQVEEGSVATPFEQRPVGLELQLCQRYYEMAESLSTGMVAYASGAFSITSPIRFCVPKRVSSNFFSADVSGMATTAGATCSSGTVTSPVHFNPIADTQQARLIITHSGTAPAGAVLLGNVSWTADAEL